MEKGNQKSTVLPVKKHPRIKEIQEIFKTLENAGHDTVIAGGAVRDWLLGLEPKDIDFVTSALPEEIEKIFKKTVPVGKAFGVMMVVINGHAFEVATFRKEGPYLDGRRPSEIEPAHPEEDAQRRDFTINGLFYDLMFEEIWDYVEGLKDIRSKTLRAIGEPLERFKEDHLRVLRAYRFQAQLGFSLDSALEKALKKSSELLTSVSRERVRDEVLKLMEAPQRPAALKLMVENKVFATLLPKVPWSIQNWLAWRGKSAHRGLLELGLWYLKLGGNPEDLHSALMLSNEQKSALKEGLSWWQGEASFKDLSLGQLVEKFWNADFRAGYLEFELTWPGSTESFKEKCQRAWKLFLDWGEVPPQPLLTAKDLPDLQGPELGKKLKLARYAQLEKKFLGKDDLLSWLRKSQ